MVGGLVVAVIYFSESLETWKDKEVADALREKAEEAKWEKQRAKEARRGNKRLNEREKESWNE